MTHATSKKAARKRNEYVARVRRLVAEVFCLSDQKMRDQNQIWEDWVRLRPRHRANLQWMILGSDVNDVFKARALCILLTPKLRWAPFFWTERHSQSDYLPMGAQLEFHHLSPLLLRFLCELVTIGADRVLASDDYSLMSKTLVYYNELIRCLLPLFSEDDPLVEQLFERYQLNDPVPIWVENEYQRSGYRPFRSILMENVSEKWKRRADEKMRTIIEQEQRWHTPPRRMWEGALSWYMEHIQSWFVLIFEQPYSIDLFASQIDFFLGVPKSEDQIYIDSSDFGDILDFLAGSEYKGLRHRLARYVILEKQGEEGGFVIDDSDLDSDARVAAEKVLQEFGDDQELCKRTRELLAPACAKVRVMGVIGNEQVEAEKAILDRMR